MPAPPDVARAVFQNGALHRGQVRDALLRLEEGQIGIFLPGDVDIEGQRVPVGIIEYHPLILVGVPLQTLKDLNPQYRHEIVPGNEREYILRIPYQYSGAFIDHEDSLYAYKADELFNPIVIKKIQDGGDGERIIHRVQRGEVLGMLAIRYRCSVSQIKRWNNLRSDNIRIGQRLVIYRGGTAPSTSSSASKSVASTAKSASPQKFPADTEYTIYTVKNGDSLYLIAKNYPGVSAQNIMDFNGISSKIKPGMKIKIPKL